ncbi:MAG TPA: sialate O-acetylesterase [Tepidisphaeraceae bacterium]|jgi:sialate O-acetylesterase|nr:sialate O-acetylesterase [Tepidisphaeraceae bacterium]
MKVIQFTAAVVLGMACSFVSADVKVASVFTDHMVLQRDKGINVWGMADAGKKVMVKVGEDEESTKADKEGKWMVKLGKRKASETPVEMKVSEEGGNSETISDVLVGDVWVCSGQSNMEFPLSRAANATEAIAGATDEKIRLLLVPKKVSDTPLMEQAGKWEVCSPETVKRFTAVGYFFAKELREKEHVPVGLVGTYWGGTVCEAWTPDEDLKDAQWKPLWDRDKKQVEEYTTVHAKYEEDLKAWKAKPEAERGKKPVDGRGENNPNRPGVLWNGMVAPLVPMSISGAIWYQGEANTARAEQYRSIFPNMIEGWRDEFKQKAPFFFVQLANYGSRIDSAAGSPWAELREAQAMTLKLPKTGMAVTIDIGNPANIHPTDKETVGKRLAKAAEAVAYGRDVAYEGPTYKSMKVDGNKAIVKFAHAKGLMTKGGEVKGFMIAGEDKKFVPAEAKLDGETVIVTAASVEKPVAVRYAWADAPESSLYNAADLPGVPFRTDNWPMATAGKK